MTTSAEVRARARLALKADAVEIQRVNDTLFLIVGFKRNTRDNPGYWCRNSDGTERLDDWEYIARQVIASGQSMKQLSESLEEYIRVSSMTMEEYLKEQVAKP